MTEQELRHLAADTAFTFPKKEAEKYAKVLADGEKDGWTYVVEPDGGKYEFFHRIAIFNEKGEFVAYWGCGAYLKEGDEGQD